MTILHAEEQPIRSSEDMVRIRQTVRQHAVQNGFSLVDQTKLVTAASELARNALEHGRGGTMLLEVIASDARRAVRLTFQDHGPGIADIPQAMRDGFTTGGGLGLGLGGAKRLCSEFDITSVPGEGTRVTIARWR